MIDWYQIEKIGLGTAVRNEIEKARAAALEECAKLAETVPINTFMTESHINQTKEARRTIATAIRSLSPPTTKERT